MNRESPELMTDEELMTEFFDLLDKAVKKFEEGAKNTRRTELENQVRELRKYLRPEHRFSYIPSCLQYELRKRGFTDVSRFVHD